MAPSDEIYADTMGIADRGNAVTGISEELDEVCRRGRSLEIPSPGLVTGPAFTNFREAWLGEGQAVSLDLDQVGSDVTSSSNEHEANEHWQHRGYQAVRPVE